MIAEGKSDQQARRGFKTSFQCLNEGSGIEAVDDAMIEGRRQVHHLANDDLTVTRARALRNAVDADDRDFGRLDDRRRRDAAEGPGLGNASVGSGHSLWPRLQAPICLAWPIKSASRPR